MHYVPAATWLDKMNDCADSIRISDREYDQMTSLRGKVGAIEPGQLRCSGAIAECASRVESEKGSTANGSRVRRPDIYFELGTIKVRFFVPGSPIKNYLTRSKTSSKNCSKHPPKIPKESYLKNPTSAKSGQKSGIVFHTISQNEFETIRLV